MLLLLAGVRCIYTISEQPSSSLMPRFDYIKYVKTVLRTVLGCPWLEVPLPAPEIDHTKNVSIILNQNMMQAKIGPTWTHPQRSQVTWELTDISVWNPQSAGELRPILRSWVDVSGLGQVPTYELSMYSISYLIYRSNLFRVSLLWTISSLYSRWIYEKKLDHQSTPKHLLPTHMPYRHGMRRIPHNMKGNMSVWSTFENQLQSSPGTHMGVSWNRGTPQSSILIGFPF